MERRQFLKTVFGVVAGAAALAAGATAAPLSPQPLGENDRLSRDSDEIQPAVVSNHEVDRLKPEPVRWGHGHHYGWGRRHWGWRHRHWGWRRHRHWRRYW